MRRHTGNMSGQRYCGNRHHLKVHDLDCETADCEIDAILKAGHDRPFDTLSDATAEGFVRCDYCLGRK